MNRRQQRFADHYVIDPNATQAAVKAGYSQHTAKSQGQRLLTNVDVAAAIEAAEANRREKASITAAEVLTGLRTEALGREDSTSGSRVQAWAHLGKHLHLFDEKITFDGTLTIEVVRFGDDEPKVIEHETDT